MLTEIEKAKKLWECKVVFARRIGEEVGTDIQCNIDLYDLNCINQDIFSQVHKKSAGDKEVERIAIGTAHAILEGDYMNRRR